MSECISKFSKNSIPLHRSAYSTSVWKIWEAFAVECGYPVDVIVMATERFEETKGVIGGVAYPAHKYGRVLYEAA